jgi:hypothetical protein
MSIIKKTAADILFNNYDAQFPSNVVVRCPKYIMFDLIEMKKLIGKIDAFNSAQSTESNKIKQLKCVMVAELPHNSPTNVLNMFMTAEKRDFSLDTKPVDPEVILGRPCPPGCVTDNHPASDHYLKS